MHSTLDLFGKTVSCQKGAGQSRTGQGRTRRGGLRALCCWAKGLPSQSKARRWSRHTNDDDGRWSGSSTETVTQDGLSMKMSMTGV
jgi:hypothetical protein